MVAHWDNAYRNKYAALKNQPNAIKDADRIVDEIKETMNPPTRAEDWVEDKLTDETFKRYWPTLAKLARFAPAVEFARISLTPSETASDKDNLTLLNTNTQDALTKIVSPGLKDNWLSEYQGIAKRVLTTSTGVPGPEIKPPR